MSAIFARIVCVLQILSALGAAEPSADDAAPARPDASALAQPARPLPAGMVVSKRYGLVISKKRFIELKKDWSTGVVPRAQNTNTDPDIALYVPTDHPDRYPTDAYRKIVFVPKSFYPPRSHYDGPYAEQWGYKDDNEKAYIDYESFLRLGGKGVPLLGWDPALRPVTAYVMARVYPETFDLSHIGAHLDGPKRVEADQAYCAFLESICSLPVLNSALQLHDHGFSKEFALAVTGDAMLFLPWGGVSGGLQVACFTGHMSISAYDLATGDDQVQANALINLAFGALDAYQLTRHLRTVRAFGAPRLAPELPLYIKAVGDPGRVFHPRVRTVAAGDGLLDAIHFSRANSALDEAPVHLNTPLPIGLDMRAHAAQMVEALPDQAAKEIVLADSHFQLLLRSTEPIEVASLGKKSTFLGYHEKVGGQARAMLNGDKLYMETYDSVTYAFHELDHSLFMGHPLQAKINSLRVKRGDGSLMDEDEFVKETIQRLIRQEAIVTIRTAHLAEKIANAGGIQLMWPFHARILRIVRNQRYSGKQRLAAVEHLLLNTMGYRATYESPVRGLYRSFDAEGKLGRLEGAQLYEEDLLKLLEAP